MSPIDVLESFSFEGVLFDLDGTLVNSAAAVRRYWEKIAADLRVNVETIVRDSQGRRSIDTVGLHDPAKATWEYVNKMESSVPYDPPYDASEVPGTTSLLRQLIALQVPWAIVTSCTRGLLLGWVSKLSLPEPLQTVAAEDVATGKPDPECYSLARERLGKAQAPMLVVEDSPNGIRAGKAAGCKVLGVMTNVSSDKLAQAGADWVVPDYTAIEAEKVGEEGKWRLRLSPREGKVFA